jgi:VanZ family protein
VSTTAPRAIAPLALMVLIFYLSGRESVGPELPAWTRVVAHFAQYAVLTALWVWALAPVLGRRAFAAAAAISLAYAITDEFHQSFVEGRDSDPLDVLVDAAGIGFAVSLLATRSRRTARRAPGPPA